MTHLLAPLLFVLSAHAGDLYPSLPRDIVCTMKVKDGKRLRDEAPDMFRLPDYENPSRIRQKLADQIATEHLPDAFDTACADKSADGLRVLSMIRDACRAGCDQEITKWPLNGREREDQVELCRADCRAGIGMLMGFAFGIQTARGR